MPIAWDYWLLHFDLKYGLRNSSSSGSDSSESESESESTPSKPHINMGIIAKYGGGVSILQLQMKDSDPTTHVWLKAWETI